MVLELAQNVLNILDNIVNIDWTLFKIFDLKWTIDVEWRWVSCTIWTNFLDELLELETVDDHFGEVFGLCVLNDFAYVSVQSIEVLFTFLLVLDWKFVNDRVYNCVIFLLEICAGAVNVLDLSCESGKVFNDYYWRFCMTLHVSAKLKDILNSLVNILTTVPK